MILDTSAFSTRSGAASHHADRVDFSMMAAAHASAVASVEHRGLTEGKFSRVHAIRMFVEQETQFGRGLVRRSNSE